MMEKKTRTTHRRAPKGAVEDPKLKTQPTMSATPYGGFPTDLAEHHLRNFHNGNLPEAHDVFHFRTTRALVVAGRRWRKLANDRLKNIGQNMARWETLYLLASSDEELSQGELARVVGVEGPTMVSMLNSLAQDDLIERHQSSVDRRVTHNRITPKGRQVAQDIMAITNGLRTDVLKDIDPEKLAVTLEVLESIHARLDQLS